MNEQPLLRLVGVTKVFGEGASLVHVLDNVDLEVTGGIVTAIMGPSGAGKTTLLTIAGGLQRPTSGHVEVMGERIEGLPQGALATLRRTRIGFVFQSANLLEALSARENVEYMVDLAGDRRGLGKERATELLRMVGLEKRMDARPKQLSGGEQQRVCVARALANRARLILADEPTANLDSQRAAEIMGLLRSLSRDMDCGILLVTHDVRAREQADRAFWLEDGHLSPR